MSIFLESLEIEICDQDPCVRLILFAIFSKKKIVIRSTFYGLIEIFIFQASQEIDHDLWAKKDIFTSSSVNKNGHILPRGQWYPPSAVINDALIDTL